MTTRPPLSTMRRIETKVVSGTQLASGTSTTHPLFNEDGGTIHLQIAPFQQHGLDLDTYFGARGFKRATLNLSIAPDYFRIRDPHRFDYRLENVQWTDKMDCDGYRKTATNTKPPLQENFYLSPVRLIFREKDYKGLLYVPDHHSKPAGHLLNKPYLEIIAEPIPGLTYGDTVSLFYRPDLLDIIHDA